VDEQPCVVLFGGLRGAPAPSMERYAEAMEAELPGLGWPAQLVRGSLWRPVGPSPLKYAALEFCRHVRYPHAVRGLKADIYHITDHSFGCLANALPLDHTVVTCHDLIPWMCDIFPGRIRRAIGLPLFERSVRAMGRAAHVVCDSSRTMRDVIERIGMPENRVSVVPLAAGDAFTRYSPEQRQEARRCFGFAPNACVVLHAGSAAAYKNLETVIRAVAALRESGVECAFAKVGPLSDEQQALIAAMDLQSCLRQFRNVGDDVLCSLYNAADVMLFPSHYEGFGLPPLEAMKAGLPVVISTAEALVETTGGLVPAFEANDYGSMADAIREIWEKRSARDSNTRSAQLYADTFTWRSTAAAMAEIYGKILQYAGEA
jgi:glycosyltransferase involved in cell wall biosynthesis